MIKAGIIKRIFNNISECVILILDGNLFQSINGRVLNDTEGNFFCIANEGACIVDYMIASVHLFQFFTDFGIDDMDWSIHFPLFCKLNFTLNEKKNYSLKSNVYLQTWHKFKWKPEL